MTHTHTLYIKLNTQYNTQPREHTHTLNITKHKTQDNTHSIQHMPDSEDSTHTTHTHTHSRQHTQASTPCLAETCFHERDRSAHARGDNIPAPDPTVREGPSL